RLTEMPFGNLSIESSLSERLWTSIRARVPTVLVGTGFLTINLPVLEPQRRHHEDKVDGSPRQVSMCACGIALHYILYSHVTVLDEDNERLFVDVGAALALLNGLILLHSHLEQPQH
ncbi:hypothetical protein HAX54_048835, partial [Datura stramonium]|nr:hypothetical protein [Datura stramonium]